MNQFYIFLLDTKLKVNIEQPWSQIGEMVTVLIAENGPKNQIDCLIHTFSQRMFSCPCAV